MTSGKPSATDRATFDVAVTAAVARMLTAVRVGRVDPRSLDWGYDVAQKEFDVAAAVEDVRDGKALGATLDSLQPSFTHYTRALKLLAAYRALVAKGEPPAVPDLPKGRKLEPGKSWTGVPQLAARLRNVGDLPQNADIPADATLYSGPLVDAVKSFQARHGLDDDGVLGSTTIRTINVPLAQRVRQIELAMERMRWLPTLSDRPNVFVNVALVPDVGDRSGHRRRTAPDERRRRQVARSPDADLRRADGVRDLPPLLESAARHHRGRDPAACAARSRIHQPARTWRSSPTAMTTPAVLPATRHNLDAVEAGRLHVAAAAWSEELARAGQVHLPERRGHLHARHAGAATVLDAPVAISATAASGWRIPGRFAAWVLRDQPEWTAEKIDEAMQGDRPTRVNLKQKLTVVIFYDTVHVNSRERGLLRRRHLRPRHGARRGAAARISVSAEG